MAGDGPAADSSGNIYFLDANGTFDDTLNSNGFPEHGDYGNAFIKLSTAGNSLSVADYFTMFNTDAESNADQDLGSGGEMLLPDVQDTQQNTWHLAVGAGKDGHIYVVNRDLMGKFNTSNDSAIHQEIDTNGLGGGVWCHAGLFQQRGVLRRGGRPPAGVFHCEREAGDAGEFVDVRPVSDIRERRRAFRRTGRRAGIVWAVENNGSGRVARLRRDEPGDGVVQQQSGGE